MFTFGKNKETMENALILAPMEDVTDVSFRIVCKELGADIVYTEFVNAEGLIRDNEKTHQKLKLIEEERPAGIQIYGANIESMVEAARIAEREEPDVIDINAGCWVKKVAGRGAGAGLLKDPDYLEDMVKQVVDAVDLPVTVKTRIGWDSESIKIVEIAQRLEDTGITALTIHCRTRTQGHSGEPDWEWINKAKEVVDIPVFLNGNVMTAEDVLRAFRDTTADGVMIARGAIGNPWIFKEAKEMMRTGVEPAEVTPSFRVETALKHLKLAIEIKGERRAVIEHRKYYTGYLKGLYRASQIRTALMQHSEYQPVADTLYKYLNELEEHELAV